VGEKCGKRGGVGKDKRMWESGWSYEIQLQPNSQLSVNFVVCEKAPAGRKGGEGSGRSRMILGPSFQSILSYI